MPLALPPVGGGNKNACGFGSNPSGSTRGILSMDPDRVRNMRSSPRLLPPDCWTKDDDLMAPCAIESAIIITIVNIQDHFRLKYPVATTGRCDIDDEKWLETITCGCTRTLTYFMKLSDIPDLESMSWFLTSICKEMLSYHENVVSTYTRHYMNNGTSGFETLEFGSDPDSDHYQFYLFFMDIKGAVHHWIKDEHCVHSAKDPVKEGSMKGFLSKRRRS